MIQAIDLKIGNYVYRGEEQEVRTITGIDCAAGVYSGVYLNNSLGRTLLNEINPIPLTKEHLEIFDFQELLNNLYSWDTFPFMLEFVDDFNEIEPYWNIRHGQMYFKVKIKYVHELQNIIYSFTKIELKLNK